jgi:peptide/nickel transport system substrate-binding protein
VSRRVPRVSLLSALVLVCAAVAAGCGGGGDGPQRGSTTGTEAGSSFYTGPVLGGQPQRGGVLRVVTSELPPALEPALVNLYPQSEIFDHLVEWETGKTTPQPGIATKWTISPDGRTYDFTLRTGVRFSDGTPLTAEDVAYSLRRMMTAANTTGQFIFPNTFRSIRVVSPTHVQFVLTKPQQAMLTHLTAVAIVPRRAFKKITEQFTTKPIGSGPFMVKSFGPGKSLELVRNPHYWRAGRPYLDGVTYTVVADANQRILKVRSGGQTLRTV